MRNSSPDRPGVPAASMDRFIHLAATAETPLDIGRPAAEIFDYLADFSHLGEWEQTTQRVESVPEGTGAPAAGSRFQALGSFGPRWDKLPFAAPGDGQPYIIEVVALERPTRVAWRATAAEPPSSETEIVLEPVREAITTVRMRVRLIAPRERLEALVQALEERGYPLDVVQRQVDRSMFNLRTILEGRAHRAG